MGLTREMFNSISLLLCLVTDVMSQLGRKGATKGILGNSNTIN